VSQCSSCLGSGSLENQQSGGTNTKRGFSGKLEFETQGGWGVSVIPDVLTSPVTYGVKLKQRVHLTDKHSTAD
jgi:hypothetical protein